MKKFLITASIIAPFSLQAMQEPMQAFIPFNLPKNCEGMRYAQQAINNAYELDDTKFDIPLTCVDTYEAWVQLHEMVLRLLKAMPQPQDINQPTYAQVEQQFHARQVTQIEVSIKNNLLKSSLQTLLPEIPMYNEPSPAPSEQIFQSSAQEAQLSENQEAYDPGMFLRNGNHMSGAEVSLRTGELSPLSHTH